MGYKSVLFDFDGVIGKTMEDNYNAWAYALNTVGISIDKNDYFMLEGLSAKDVAKKFLLDLSDDSLSDMIVSLKEQHYMSHHSFEFYPSAIELIENLKIKEFKLAIVSGANAQRLERTVSHSFLNNFDTIVTGDGIHESKPSPEPYLKASEKLGIIPEECLVVENAPLGIESAKKAGMTCIAVTSTLEKKYLKKADRVVSNIIEIQEIIEKGRLK